MQIQEILLVLVGVLYEVLSLCLLARVILSWFPHKETFISNFLEDITDPILEPLKKILPTFGGIDFSPVVAIFLLGFLRTGLISLIMYFL